MDTIEIAGRTYELLPRLHPNVKEKIRIYKGHDSYVRVGAAARIDRIVATHRRLAGAGAPVPQLLEEGTIGDEKYVIEKSLGQKILRLEFADEVAAQGHVSDASFASLVELMRRYLIAQTALQEESAAAEFLSRMHIEALCEELPDFAPRIREVASNCVSSLSGFPFVLSHGDLSPNNIVASGIIDLEDSVAAPFGFDAVSVLVTGDWFPGDVDFEFEVTPYHVTPGQKAEYLAMCDSVCADNGFPLISRHIFEFDFFRVAWLTAGMDEWPKTQRYRHERFVKEYLKA